MQYHTYVVTYINSGMSIVCCARSEQAAIRMGMERWGLKLPELLSALRVPPGEYVDV